MYKNYKKKHKAVKTIHILVMWDLIYGFFLQYTKSCSKIIIIIIIIIM